LALLAGPLQENLRDSGHLTGELRRGPLSNMVGSAQPIVLLGTEGRRKSYVEPRVTATFRLSQANHSRTNFVGQCRRNETARVASQSQPECSYATIDAARISRTIATRYRGRDRLRRGVAGAVKLLMGMRSPLLARHE